jgi:uncharacterized protein
MTIFLDTSAWVKFFLQEEGTTKIQDFLLTEWLSGTHVFTASPITYAETLSTLKRAHRGQRLGDEEFARAVSLFEEQWANTQVVAVDMELITRSGQLAKEYGLRGCDAFQLATALQAQTNLFIGADLELNDTAKICGLTVWNPTEELEEEAASITQVTVFTSEEPNDLPARESYQPVEAGSET